MGAVTVQQHHHRSTAKSPHRPFKSRHATKGTLKDLAKGKVESNFSQNRKTRHQQIMSKIDRRHQARQKAKSKHKIHLQNTSVFSGQKGAPRIVSVVPLSKDCDTVTAIHALNQSLEIDAEIVQGSPNFVEVDRFKQKLQYIAATRELFNALDSCRVADYVVFILSATEEVDPQGELLLRTIESQGISNVITVVQGLELVQPLKKRSQVATSLKSFITHFFPTQERVYSLDSPQECVNVMRSLCTSTPKGIRWREERSWMLVESVQQSDEDPGDPSKDTRGLVLRGTVRGKGLKANRLLQLGDFGTYQIDKIVTAPALRGKKRKADKIATDMETDQKVLDVPDADQDDLANLAPEDISMEAADAPVSEAPVERKGVLLDDHHYFSDDEPQPARRPKRLPKGTSDYQAAWYLDDVSYSGSDLESEVDDDGIDEGSEEGLDVEDGFGDSGSAVMRDDTEAAPSEYPQSEMFIDRPVDDEAEELAAYRKSRKSEAEDDLEFPDEIELRPEVLARERLARYRGLKSLKTSPWDTSEDAGHEPQEWNRLLQVPDYKGAKSRALGEALLGGVAPGNRVDVHLRQVPSSLYASIQACRCLTAFSLLRHEHKQTAMNVTFTLDGDYPVPLKSKEEVVVQCGPRRFLANPLYSNPGSTPNNVHKFDRFLHPGRTSMASFIAPMTWGAVPAVYFRRVKRYNTQEGDTLSDDSNALEFIGTGTVQPPDQTRVVAKRVILTGHPYKIHKKVVTVRYMFFNTEDVRWFKALQLWTRRGRSGFVKESLGTHGYFKANFDAKINPQDSVAVSLYKRVFPRIARPWAEVVDKSLMPDSKSVEVMAVE